MTKQARKDRNDCRQELEDLRRQVAFLSRRCSQLKQKNEELSRLLAKIRDAVFSDMMSGGTGATYDGAGAASGSVDAASAAEIKTR